MIKGTRNWIGALLALTTSLGIETNAQNPQESDVTNAVSAFIVQRFQSQTTNDEPAYPIVVADVVTLRGAIMVKEVSAPIFSRSEARDRQLAWFIYLSKIEQTETQTTIEYQTPFNASGGTATLERNSDGWKLSKNEKWRSSSGARSFYGELYEGVACRNDTEMARRQLTLGGMKDAPAKAKCSSKEFPEVAAYQQMKQLLKK